MAITGLAEQAAFASGRRQVELDTHEMDAAFAAVEAEERGGDGGELVS